MTIVDSQRFRSLRMRARTHRRWSPVKRSVLRLTIPVQDMRPADSGRAFGMPDSAFAAYIGLRETKRSQQR